MQSLHSQIFWESYLAVATKIKNAQTLWPSNLNFKNLSFKWAGMQGDVYKYFCFDNICGSKSAWLSLISTSRSGMNKELYIHCLKYYIAINMLIYFIKWKSKLQCKCIYYLFFCKKKKRRGSLYVS